MVNTVASSPEVLSFAIPSIYDFINFYVKALGILFLLCIPLSLLFNKKKKYGIVKSSFLTGLTFAGIPCVIILLNIIPQIIDSFHFITIIDIFESVMFYLLLITFTILLPSFLSSLAILNTFSAQSILYKVLVLVLFFGTAYYIYPEEPYRDSVQTHVNQSGDKCYDRFEEKCTCLGVKYDIICLGNWISCSNEKIGDYCENEDFTVLPNDI